MVIYKTINNITRKYYIGKDSRNSPSYIGSGKLIKESILKYGKENFTKEILEEIPGHDLNLLLEREIYWIDKYDAINDENSYNLIRDSGVGKQTPTRITDEVREKLSMASKKMWKNPIIREKIISASIGKKQTDFQKKRASEANKGKVYGENTREKIRAYKTGRPMNFSDEAKKNISNAAKKRWEDYRNGKSNCYSEEIRKRISEKTKLSMTPERRRILSEQAKERWRIKKEIEKNEQL